MRPDEARLLDILLAAEEVRQLCHSLDYEAFTADRTIQLAVIKLLEIIGEAARRLSEDTRTAAPGIAWGDIAGMRNVLVHQYWEVDLEPVWLAVKGDIPQLVETVRILLAARTADEPGEVS